MNCSTLEKGSIMQVTKTKPHEQLSVKTESKMVTKEATSRATIKGNKIYYADHYLVCDPTCATPEYMSDVESELSPDGDAKKHKRELYFMNNDGTWTVKKRTKQVTKIKPQKHLQAFIETLGLPKRYANKFQFQATPTTREFVTVKEVSLTVLSDFLDALQKSGMPVKHNNREMSSTWKFRKGGYLKIDAHFERTNVIRLTQAY